MSLNKEQIDMNYEATLYALSLGVELEIAIEMEYEAANANEFSVAEGMRQAISVWLNRDKFNCRIGHYYGDHKEEI